MLKRSLIFTCLLLSSCATPEEVEARRQAQMKADYETCVEEYGFKPQSDAARNCMLQIELSRQERRDYYSGYYYGGYYGHRHPGASVGYYIRP